MRRNAVFAVCLVALVAAAGAGAYLFVAGGQGCGPNYAYAAKYQATKVLFGGVTEYCLANPSRWTNGIASAQDGSVWFGEQALPGLGHLFANGTVVEYQWPGSRSTTISEYQTGIWGVLQWNGRIWGADLDGNRVVGLNPADGTMTSINATSAPFPYLLDSAPDGSMWFTSLHSPAKLGRIDTDLSLTTYKLSGLGKEEPIQLSFVNSTMAYLVALDPLSGAGNGGLFSFDPQSTNGTIVATRVGGDFSLVYPDGVSYSGGAVWVTQHGPSNVLRFEPATGQWTVYPTSTVSYQPSTWPYFVEASGTRVWFNEHYANRIALMDTTAGTLTEFSEANPPITNGSEVQNDLTISLGGGGLWFTSTSGNYVGFVDGSYSPPFSLRVAGQKSLDLGASGSANVTLTLSGTWAQQLHVQVSDSETSTSVPSRISIIPSMSSLSPGSGPTSFIVTLRLVDGLHPGRYTIGVTVTDGMLYQTAFVYLTVA